MTKLYNLGHLMGAKLLTEWSPPTPYLDTECYLISVGHCMQYFMLAAKTSNCEKLDMMWPSQ